MRKLFTIFTLLIFATGFAHGRERSVQIQFNARYMGVAHSIILDWSDGTLHWSAYHYDKEIVAPSRLTMVTDRGVWGENVSEAKIKRSDYINYSSAVVDFGDYSVELRAYNFGVAYRFISNIDGDYKIIDELAEFSFNKKDMAWIPYVNYRPDATSDYATQFETSFENTYTHTALKDIDWRRLIFAPIVVEHKGVKAWISESNLEDYPGMFLSNRDGDGVLDTEFAPRPKEVEQGGHNMLQGMVKSRHDYIAECHGARTFPWRAVAMSKEDRKLAAKGFVWELADECRIEDTSWIKPGKVAWEWWNDWGLEGVDFEVGINNATYKYYIDFASRYGIEYVIIDEGWSVNLAADLMQVVPEIDIKELVDYAAERNVGIILWAGYWALNRDIEGLCKHYSEMGVKGWKVDFLDRDDQEMVEFVYDLAEIAAKYHMIVDYHGIYKPTGLNRTYPNAINFEGVHGLETMKWLGAEHDQITYDVTLPFIRGAAGPMDYTQGAMRNAAKGHYYPDYSHPMSQGTRCHQLAMYIVYHARLMMLCDSPTNYEKEPEFTKFLAQIPTKWNLGVQFSKDCKIGEYVQVMADNHIDNDEASREWYIAGLNGHKARTATIQLSPTYVVKSVEVYVDGDNAKRDGSDYKHYTISKEEYNKNKGVIKVKMAPGGGFVIRLTGNLIWDHGREW
ncbi:MAG: glycoside hydrolase family 97 protein [Alistipes sp.]|nr:glycoside hydrolase family 97 protein [Alistipes sp.]